MKNTIMCILSFFLFFSCIDLSVINLLKVSSSNYQFCTISDVVKIQYDILQKTKIVVSNVCDNILSDVCYLLSSKQTNKTFFDMHKSEQNVSIYICFNYFKQIIPIKLFKNNFYTNNMTIPIFYFEFIFLFILSYLGLLFTFGKEKLFQYYYKKAYSI